MERKHTPVYGIKGKLISAVCMLLVAVIMVVSSTYAWFTLSTAPEVTGISTAIGANGALEIWLNRSDEGNNDINATPGNLVNLGLQNGVDNYGLTSIKLYPSTLNVEDGVISNTGFLTVPSYGADGRPTFGTDAKKTINGIYSGNFYESNDTGVRGLGLVSGMTERQYAYRNATGAVKDAISKAQKAAATSLSDNGSNLANLIVKKAMGDGKYNKTDIENLQAVVNDLIGTNDKTGILQHIEQAYLNQVVALAASEAANKIGESDTAGKAIYDYVSANINTGNLTLAKIAENNGFTISIDHDDNAETAARSYTITLPVSVTVTGSNGDTTYSIGTDLLAGIEAYVATVGKANQAKAGLATLHAQLVTGEGTTDNTDDDTVDWNTLHSTALQYIVNADRILVNDKTADDIKQNTTEFANSVISAGGTLTVVMQSGSGLYTDVADHCGQYSANVTVSGINAGGMTNLSAKAKMTAQTNENPPMLESATTDATKAGAPSNASAGALPMTEFFGYVLDLGFQTNAASSNLLLQVDAVDRIYENNNNEETMGHGSSMTFKSTSPDFTTDQVKELMKAIRIVFFDTEDLTVLAYAKLDVANSETTSLNGEAAVLAKMYLYESVTGYDYTYTVGTGDSASVTKGTVVLKEITQTTVKYTKDSDSTEVTVTDETLLTPVDGQDNKYTYNGETITKTETTDTVIKYYKVVNGSVTNEEDAVAAEHWNDQTGFTKTEVTVDNKLTDNVITELPQNDEVYVSTLVYLEGDPNKGGVENGDVSATGTTSVEGSMNIQFGSSAELTPMEYGELHTPAQTTP